MITTNIHHVRGWALGFRRLLVVVQDELNTNHAMPDGLAPAYDECLPPLRTAAVKEGSNMLAQPNAEAETKAGPAVTALQMENDAEDRCE